jgi:hypothetical protein
VADNKQVWSAYGESLTDISATNLLQNLSNGAAKMLGIIDNTGAPRYRLAAFEAYLRFTSAPTAGAYCTVYFVLSLDGTNYEDGSDTGPVLPARSPAFSIPLRAVSTQQKIEIPFVLLPPMKCKALFYNTAGYATTNTSGENTLSYRRYSPMVE